MNWKSFASRLLLIGVAFPVLGVLIFLLPQIHHLVFNIVVVAGCVVGALEMQALFEARGSPTARWLAPTLAGTLPLAVWLEVAGLVPAGWVRAWPSFAIGLILVRSLFLADARKLAGILPFVASSLFVVLYPSFFLSWIVRFSALQNPSLSILLFLCMVFGNDMAAYFAGSLWGGSTRLNLPISPQKTAVGFIAGLAGTLIVYAFFRLVIPSVLPSGVPEGVAFAVVMGVAVILGDLVESGLKRSASVKDSGIIIPGRGGMLDSVDSMILSAPLFYGLMRLLGR
ncbi:MAG: phosphatidate cytidylyltransferase [Spirochaetia bacterium]